ncbi:CGP-CTERM sorting domain-containing protein [Thermococcus atlanticus]
MKRAAAMFLTLLMVFLVQMPAAKAEVYPSDIFVTPSIGVPAVGVPGDTITMEVKDGVQISQLTIVSVLHGPYNLQIVGKDGNLLKVKIPENVVPDDYFLQVKSNKGDITLPNGLVVLKEYPKVLKIAQVSDTHITSGAKVGYVCRQYFQRSPMKLAKLCQPVIPLHSVVATDSAYTYWAMQGVDFIFNTGDDVDTSGDIKGYQILYNILSRTVAAGTPVINIKGNHDDPPTVYSKLIGPRYFYEVIGDFIIIGLDSRGEEGHPEMAQIEWMEKVLEEHKGKIPIVLVHHPYFFSPRWNYLGGILRGLDPFSDSDWNELKGYLRYWAGEPDVARRFLEDVVKYNIRLVLSGHIHHDMYWLYIDKNGNKHWFITLTSTGAPDKETNPHTNPRYSPTWYGSNLIYVYDNGTVVEPEVHVKIENDKVRSDFMSVPVPQEFIVFRHHGKDGTAVKFINELNESVSGPITLVIPEGAKVDPSVTNITYTVLGERTIDGTNYMLINATVPVGVSQIVVSKEKDTQKPKVEIAYTFPSKPKMGRAFKVYFKAADNIGIRSMYVEIEANGKTVRYPGEPTKGDPANIFYVAQIPGVNADHYTIRVVVTDFYGNKAVDEKVMGKPASTTTTTTSTTSSSTSTPTSTSSSPTATSTTASASTTSTAPSSSSPTQTSSTGGGSTCGPAALVGLALVPLLLRRRR